MWLVNLTNMYTLCSHVILSIVVGKGLASVIEYGSVVGVLYLRHKEHGLLPLLVQPDGISYMISIRHVAHTTVSRSCKCRPVDCTALLPVSIYTYNAAYTLVIVNSRHLTLKND